MIRVRTRTWKHVRNGEEATGNSKWQGMTTTHDENNYNDVE